MYECFHCGERAVGWDADFDFSDYGLEGEGIVHTCHCNHCGAHIEYYVPVGGENDEGNSEPHKAEGEDAVENPK